MARPSQLWYPTSLVARAAWHNVFSGQAQIDGTSHGLTAAECDQIKDDAAMVEFLKDVAGVLEAYNDNVRSYRKSVMEDPIDGTTPAFPANIGFTPPTAVPRGIWERVIEYAARIKASAGYTVAIGESYGIEGSSPAPAVPSEVKPTIVLAAAVHDYLFSIVVSGREDADAWEVWVKPGLATEFQLVKTATGKSTDVTFNPGAEQPGPVQLEVEVRLKRNNAYYGQPSEIGRVTVNP